jgi:hypothetical protein
MSGLFAKTSLSVCIIIIVIIIAISQLPPLASPAPAAFLPLQSIAAKCDEFSERMIFCVPY